MNNEKYTQNFKTTILHKLQDVAAKDPLFAESFAKENKNIDHCINYILDTVQKSGVQGFTDAEIYSMAMHYYDEDSIDEPTAKQCHVIVNHTIELTQQEIDEQKKKSLQELHQKELSRLSKKTQPANKPTNPINQPTLF